MTQKQNDKDRLYAVINFQLIVLLINLVEHH